MGYFVSDLSSLAAKREPQHQRDSLKYGNLRSKTNHKLVFSLQLQSSLRNCAHHHNINKKSSVSTKFFLRF
jgi:hypothetical protein